MPLNGWMRGGRFGGVLSGMICIALIVGVSHPAVAQDQWEPVVGGGAAVGNGFGDANNEAVGAMAVFNGRLFAAAGGDNGPAFQLWWTENGTTWNKHPDDGFGDANNQGVVAMAVFDGFLYAGTVNASGSGSQVFRTADGVVWSAVNTNGFFNTNNVAVTSMTVHDGQLIAGTENQTSGGQIWKTTNGTSWTPVMIGGFGLPANTIVASVQSHAARLYAGTYRDSTLLNQPAEIWWTENLVDWSSGTVPGFGDNYNMAFPSMAVHDGDLFVGTSQLNFVLGAGCEVWRWNGSIWQMIGHGGFGSSESVSATRFFQFNGELLVGVENPSGCKLMRFVDILSWDTLVSDGYGNTANIGTLSGAVFDGNLYVGTVNMTDGCEVHRTASGIFSDGFESGNTDEWSTVMP